MSLRADIHQLSSSSRWNAYVPGTQVSKALHETVHDDESGYVEDEFVVGESDDQPDDEVSRESKHHCRTSVSEVYGTGSEDLLVLRRPRRLTRRAPTMHPGRAITPRRSWYSAVLRMSSFPVT
jgi:hypothetical protein